MIVRGSLSYLFDADILGKMAVFILEQGALQV
jgi:hypothetical protein